MVRGTPTCWNLKDAGSNPAQLSIPFLFWSCSFSAVLAGTGSIASRPAQHSKARELISYAWLLMRLVFSFWSSLSLCEGGCKHLLGSLALDFQRHQAYRRFPVQRQADIMRSAVCQQEGQCSDEMTNSSSCGNHVVRWIMVSPNGKGQKQGPFLLHQTYH